MVCMHCRSADGACRNKGHRCTIFAYLVSQHGMHRGRSVLGFWLRQSNPLYCTRLKACMCLAGCRQDASRAAGAEASQHHAAGVRGENVSVLVASPYTPVDRHASRLWQCTVPSVCDTRTHSSVLSTPCMQVLIRSLLRVVRSCLCLKRRKYFLCLHKQSALLTAEHLSCVLPARPLS